MELMEIVAAIVALPLLALGVRSMFMPSNMGEAVGLAPEGNLGLSEIRSVLGGFFFATVAMIVIGIVAEEPLWFLAVAVLMAAATLGRIVGLIADGSETKALPPLVVEIVIGVVMLVAHGSLT